MSEYLEYKRTKAVNDALVKLWKGRCVEHYKAFTDAERDCEPAEAQKEYQVSMEISNCMHNLEHPPIALLKEKGLME